MDPQECPGGEAEPFDVTESTVLVVLVRPRPVMVCKDTERLQVITWRFDIFREPLHE